MARAWYGSAPKGRWQEITQLMSAIEICTKPLARRTLSRARRKQSGRFQTFQTGEARGRIGLALRLSHPEAMDSCLDR